MLAQLIPRSHEHHNGGLRQLCKQERCPQAHRFGNSYHMQAATMNASGCEMHLDHIINGLILGKSEADALMAGRCCPMACCHTTSTAAVTTGCFCCLHRHASARWPVFAMRECPSDRNSCGADVRTSAIPYTSYNNFMYCITALSACAGVRTRSTACLRTIKGAQSS